MNQFKHLSERYRMLTHSFSACSTLVVICNRNTRSFGLVREVIKKGRSAKKKAYHISLIAFFHSATTTACKTCFRKNVSYFFMKLSRKKHCLKPKPKCVCGVPTKYKRLFDIISYTIQYVCLLRFLRLYWFCMYHNLHYFYTCTVYLFRYSHTSVII